MAVFLGVVVRASAIEATLVADAHINSARPAANSGSISNLNVGGGYTALLQFDIGTLPAGTTASQISRAVLRVFCNRADIPGLVNLSTINSSWGEYSVTYATRPALAAVTQSFSVSQAGTFISVDVTTLVQNWITTPSTNNGIALASDTAVLQFDSKENDLTGHAAVLEIGIVSQGPVGPKGDTGPAGLQGSQGLPGPEGPAGLQGAIGLTGATGPAGAKGDTGPVGPQGIQGPQGLQGMPGPQGEAGLAGPAGQPGMSYRGTFSLTTTYSFGDVVFWQGNSYTSLVNGNYGNIPTTGSVWWGLLSSQGAAGTQGVAGPKGDTGATGPQGPQGLSGPEGPAGPVGMTFRGAYSSSVSYAAGDGVAYDGAGYVSLANGNLGNIPDQTPALWGKFAAGTQGPPGVPGAQGSQGPQGLPGPQGPVGPQGAIGAIGPQGPQGSPGSTGAQGAIGPQGPIGATGPQGPQGVSGPAGVSFRGTWSAATNYVTNDAVSYDGSTYLALATNMGVQPDISPTAWAVFAQKGSAGATGPSGQAATVSIGTVTTGAPGTPASVTNSGTQTAAILNFTIPQGVAGSGSGSVASSSFASVYHAVSFSTPYYSINNANQAASETAAVLTWIPAGCASTALTVYSQQGNTITVTMRMGMPSSMANTALSCSVSTGSSCTSTTSVPIPAGSFTSLIITGANGTASGVWTALSCS